MSSRTLPLDEELLRRVRIRATETFLQIAKQSRASSGPGGRSWTREDLYEERMRGGRRGGEAAR